MKLFTQLWWKSSFKPNLGNDVSVCTRKGSENGLNKIWPATHVPHSAFHYSKWKMNGVCQLQSEAAMKWKVLHLKWIKKIKISDSNRTSDCMELPCFLIKSSLLLHSCLLVISSICSLSVNTNTHSFVLHVILTSVDFIYDAIPYNPHKIDSFSFSLLV